MRRLVLAAAPALEVLGVLDLPLDVVVVADQAPDVLHVASPSGPEGAAEALPMGEPSSHR
jgi:hypothetical protein